MCDRRVFDGKFARVRLPRPMKLGRNSGASVFPSFSFMKSIQFWIEEFSKKPFGYMDILGSKGEEAGSFKGKDLIIFGYVRKCYESLYKGGKSSAPTQQI